MDVMKPDLLVCEDRVYRINETDCRPGKVYSKDRFSPNIMNDERYEEIVNTDDDTSLEGTDIELLENGRYLLKMDIPNQFFGLIIGRQGGTRKRIENETKCRLIIPAQGDENLPLEISGIGKRQVLSAKTRISLLVANAREKEPFTHFVSVPFADSKELLENYEKFKSQIMTSYVYDRGVSKELFQIPEKMHLTCCTLVLLSSKEKNTAVETFKNIQNDSELFSSFSLKSFPLIVDVSGLEIMNDDPHFVNVLYGKIFDKTDRLQRLLDEITKRFRDSGLISSKTYGTGEYVKMHLTLMNTTFLGKQQEKRSKTDSEKHVTFDAANILKDLSDFYFGQICVNSICLSIRHSLDRKTGYYMSLADGVMKLS